MADEKTYNGWTNYETWCINLWIGNEPASSKYWQQEQAMEAWLAGAKTRPNFTRDEEASIILADRLKDQFEDEKPDLGSTCWRTCSMQRCPR